MTDEQKVAYVNAMVACAQIEMAGMQAENQHRMNVGNAVAYGEEAFTAIIEKYGIHHNAVLTVFQN
jgi:hypothetical protein